MRGSVPPHFYRQAAAIAHRKTDEVREILLITSRRHGRWIIPKGVVDPGETPREAAARETLEEAGVRGALSQEPVASYEYDKWGGTCTVDVFLLAVEAILETWEEADVRQRAWFDVGAAATHVRPPSLARIVLRLPEYIGNRAG